MHTMVYTFPVSVLSGCDIRQKLAACCLQLALLRRPRVNLRGEARSLSFGACTQYTFAGRGNDYCGWEGRAPTESLRFFDSESQHFLTVSHSHLCDILKK